MSANELFPDTEVVRRKIKKEKEINFDSIIVGDMQFDRRTYTENSKPDDYAICYLADGSEIKINTTQCEDVYLFLRTVIAVDDKNSQLIKRKKQIKTVEAGFESLVPYTKYEVAPFKNFYWFHEKTQEFIEIDVEDERRLMTTIFDISINEYRTIYIDHHNPLLFNPYFIMGQSYIADKHLFRIHLRSGSGIGQWHVYRIPETNYYFEDLNLLEKYGGRDKMKFIGAKPPYKPDFPKDYDELDERKAQFDKQNKELK